MNRETGKPKPQPQARAAEIVREYGPLAELEAEGRVRSIGQARARRWLSPPLTGFTTILLLPAALPIE